MPKPYRCVDGMCGAEDCARCRPSSYDAYEDDDDDNDDYEDEDEDDEEQS